MKPPTKGVKVSDAAEALSDERVLLDYSPSDLPGEAPARSRRSSTSSAGVGYARPVRIPRRLERFILGTMMSLVALIAERRVVKALGKKRP